MINEIEAFKSIIDHYEVLLWENEPQSHRFKASIYFKDGSALIVKDYLFNLDRKYSYHWQDEDDQLICRWDNAGHWKTISTYPHHKHSGEREQVRPSRGVSLGDVLSAIEGEVERGMTRDL